ncbi:MAG: enoyl-CoA hydratase/isomerase family protein [Nitrososphaerales archaeon]
MSENLVLVKKENGVCWITLNRPEVLNACDIDTLKKIQGALKDAEKDDSVRALVLTGSGRAFCAGADLGSLKKRGVGTQISLKEDLIEGFNPIVLKIRSIDKPVIAMINGVAAGAGMGLALACDLKIMAESAKFVEAFAKIGLVPDSGATFFMPRLLGISKAMELAFTGEGLDAKEAERIGAVNKVVPLDQLERETTQLAEKLAKGPRGMGLAKRAINKALYSSLEEALEYEAFIQEIAGQTEDYQEGLRAFAEKRPPDFKGR